MCNFLPVGRRVCRRQTRLSFYHVQAPQVFCCLHAVGRSIGAANPSIIAFRLSASGFRSGRFFSLVHQHHLVLGFRIFVPHITAGKREEEDNKPAQRIHGHINKPSPSSFHLLLHPYLSTLLTTFNHFSYSKY
jgi:hypothetical protein